MQVIGLEVIKSSDEDSRNFPEGIKVLQGAFRLHTRLYLNITSVGTSIICILGCFGHSMADPPERHVI